MDDSKNIEVGEFLDEDALTTTRSHCWKYMMKTWMKMLGEGINADVTFKTAGGEVLKAHRSMLTLFSHVFNTMFTCGMQEHQTGVVELIDIDVEVLKLFLVLLYSGMKCKYWVMKIYAINVWMVVTIDVIVDYASVTHLFIRDARNTMGTRGTPEWHPGLVAPMVRRPKWSYCGWGPWVLGTPPTQGD
jgi:hypothetical protein